MFIILDEDQNDVLSLQRRLYRAYIHTIVRSPENIACIANYPAHGIYIHHPEKIADLAALCCKIKELYPTVPIGITYRPGHTNYYIYKRMVDAVFEEKTTAATIIREMYRLYEEKTGQDADRFQRKSLATFRTQPGYVFAVWNAFPASYEQYMIVRYLLYKAPDGVTTDELKETCLMPGSRKAVRHIAAALRDLDALFLCAFGAQFFTYTKPGTYRINERIVDPTVEFI